MVENEESPAGNMAQLSRSKSDPIPILAPSDSFPAARLRVTESPESDMIFNPFRYPLKRSKKKARWWPEEEFGQLAEKHSNVIV